MLRWNKQKNDEFGATRVASATHCSGIGRSDCSPRPSCQVLGNKARNTIGASENPRTSLRRGPRTERVGRCRRQVRCTRAGGESARSPASGAIRLSDGSWAPAPSDEGIVSYSSGKGGSASEFMHVRSSECCNCGKARPSGGIGLAHRKSLISTEPPRNVGLMVSDSSSARDEALRNREAGCG